MMPTRLPITLPILTHLGADVDNVAAEVESTIGIDCTGAIPASAKVGIGIPEILEAIVTRMPAPAGEVMKPE